MARLALALCALAAGTAGATRSTADIVAAFAKDGFVTINASVTFQGQRGFRAVNPAATSACA